MEEVTVVIVGAGPAGLASSACLNVESISNIVLEREDCCASLWKKRSYDRLRLHLAKEFCSLPYKEHSPETSTFMSKDTFISYIDSYVSEFNITPRYSRSVESAFYDEKMKKWRIKAKNGVSGEMERYSSDYLIVASGENNEAFVPEVQGLTSFKGELIHSSEYKNGKRYKGKDVLVVGCGNSGMEISHDLSEYDARTSIVIRSPFHVLTKNMVHMGMLMTKYLPVHIVDTLISLAASITYGDLSKYGIHRPEQGPFALKLLSGKTPVIDGGSVSRIKSKRIKVVPEIVNINGTNIEFVDGTEQKFDAIIFATGYRSGAKEWLKDYQHVLDDEGMPKKKYPDHWKGENGLYCAGLSGRGLDGISADATHIAADIRELLKNKA
ncbi:hypothetical protein TIFTF001_026927 [Ficus carica]|uniref:Flavin-containing monooxygenase n=1 Tax=Ficus carica TaxID=3494 RepID=A0AA88DM62_FICCA|nr:hypothetical protein TIFTF001_026927 [Ficus carica]